MRSRITTGRSRCFLSSLKWLIRLPWLNLMTSGMHILTKQSKLTQHQSGNRKIRSTEALRLLVTDHIFRAIDQQQLTAMVLIDLGKAFDSICHSTWFESYLTDRKQSTRLGTSLSDALTITHGVPQDSILGPLLFNFPLQLSPAVPIPTLTIPRSTAPFRLETFLAL